MVLASWAGQGGPCSRVSWASRLAQPARPERASEPSKGRSQVRALRFLTFPRAQAKGSRLVSLPLGAWIELGPMLVNRKSNGNRVFLRSSKWKLQKADVLFQHLELKRKIHLRLVQCRSIEKTMESEFFFRDLQNETFNKQIFLFNSLSSKERYT